MALRELLLAAERSRPLDEAICSFSRTLGLPQNVDGDLETSEEDAEEATAKFLTIHPKGELLLSVWPEQHGAGSRWEKRESFAVFLQVVQHFLQAQTQRDVALAEEFALRIIRDKSVQLEKLLSWSDKPLIEFRALQLLGALVRVSGAAARELVRLFNFQSPVFVKMATRRWKKAEPEEDEPAFQLRRAYVDLVLALTACRDKSVHRFATKEGGLTTSLFKSMDSDSEEILAVVFEKLRELVLNNSEVEHKSKLVVFNGTCVHQLLALLQAEEDEAVRDTALGVLNAIFFEEEALYVVPTKQALRLFLSKSVASGPQNDETAITSEQMYAVKVIRNAIVTIGVNELLRSTQAQTFVMTMLAKFPGFLPEYLAALSVQLEPQPVFRWFCVASLVQKLLSCSLDAVAIGMPEAKSGEELPSWCSPQNLAARLIAPGSFRKELSRGIQHGNNLVIYSSLGIMEAMLQRYVCLAPSFKQAEVVSDVQSELRFLLPSPEALVSLLLKLCASQQRTTALIYVRALTVFRLYLECIPQAMREVKVDFTKTLAWRYLDAKVADGGEETMPAPMRSLIVAEMLRFLLVVDASRLRFLFANTGNSSQSKLLQMLVLYVSTPSQVVQELTARVLHRTLLASDVFGQDSHDFGRANEEVTFWLESLRASGDVACAGFMEQLMRLVMDDPLVYVAIGSRVLTGTFTSSSLSPMTIALVVFLNSRAAKEATSSSVDMSLYRTDSRAVTFAVRVLLALLPTSKHPQQLVKLIAEDDLSIDPTTEQKQLAKDANSDGKKRKRKADSDVSGSDPYLWLKTQCEAIASGSSAFYELLSPKKKAKATSTKWHHFGEPSAFTSALTALTPVNFTASWEEIVDNCAEVAESFDLVFHYLSARGDVDILSLLATTAQSSTKKKATSKSLKVIEFLKKLPTQLVLQHVLFSVPSKSFDEQHSMIANLTSVIKRKISSNNLAADEAARMCEQVLFFLSSSQHGFSDHGHEQLCEVLVLLLTVVIISIDPSNTSTSAVVLRIFYKLRAVATDTSSDLLRQKLLAAEIVALRLYSAKLPDTPLKSLCELSGLFQRAGVPVMAVLSLRTPANVCVTVLDKLLQQFSSTSTNAPHVVLIQRVLLALGETKKEYGSFADYKRSKMLTRKLWQLLTSQSDARPTACFTTGFTVLGELGGIDAATAVGAIESSLVPLVARSAEASVDDNYASSCTDVLRAIVTAIQGDNAATAFPVAFEKQLLQHLQRENDERIRCALVGALYNVFTRIASPALRQFSAELLPGCCERVLLPSPANRDAELALLKHMAVDDFAAVDAITLSASAGAIVKKLAKSKLNGELSTTQLLGLLLLSRTEAVDSSIGNLLPVLLRTALHVMQSGSTDFSRFDAVTVLVANAAKRLELQDQGTKNTILNIVLPVFAEAREVVEGSGSNGPVFVTFVSLTAALLRLVGHDAHELGYDFTAQLDAIVKSPNFMENLQGTSNSSVKLLTVQVIARLARITGNYTRALLQLLLSAYSMSLSTFDRSLRVLFQDFETHGELSLASMGFRFGASSTALPAKDTSHNDLVDDSAWLLGGGIEQSRVRATIEYFPLDREISTASDAALLDIGGLSVDEKEEDSDQSAMEIGQDGKAEAYDPAFLLPMLSHFISSSDLPDAGIVQQGLLGVAIRATSSSAASIRSYAYGILAHLHESLQATAEATNDFKAGRQVHLLLDVFRRAVEEPLEEVPSVLTVFLNDALAVLMRPTHVLYPQVNHFLLARPAMDLGDVPMFYSLFNSRAPLNFRQERSWLLHTLRRGVRRDDDVSLLIRRHVLPMLLSFFTSELADTHTQPLITSILLETLRTPSGGVYLLTKAALLEWIAAQFVKQTVIAGSTSSRKEKPSVRGASPTLLLPLVSLFEEALQDNVWGDLDATQQHAAALQVSNAFAALHAAASARRSNASSDRVIMAKVAVLAQLVLRRAGLVCSLVVLEKALESVQQTHVPTTAALESAELVAGSLTSWLVQQRHAEAQKNRFSDWARVIRQAATILAPCIDTAQVAGSISLDHQQRARIAFNHMKVVLDELPTLKQLVLAPQSDANTTYAPAFL